MMDVDNVVVRDRSSFYGSMGLGVEISVEVDLGLLNAYSFDGTIGYAT